MADGVAASSCITYIYVMEADEGRRRGGGAVMSNYYIYALKKQISSIILDIDTFFLHPVPPSRIREIVYTRNIM